MAKHFLLISILTQLINPCYAVYSSTNQDIYPGISENISLSLPIENYILPSDRQFSRINTGYTDTVATQVADSKRNIVISPCGPDSISDLYVNFKFTPLTLDMRHKIVTCAIPYHPDLTFEWDFGDGATGSGTVIQHYYAITNNVMNYTISLKVSKSLCERTISQVIEVIPFIPNVFTPNGDGINDVFMPDVDLKVFDRNGTVLYKGSAGWDGTYKGKIVEQDTYFYLISFTDGNHIVQTRRGFITLVK